MSPLICGINNNNNIDTENKFPVARGGIWVVGEMGEGSQKVQTSIYIIIINGCNIQHGDWLIMFIHLCCILDSSISDVIWYWSFSF